jgi:hypothetical protein
MTSPGPLSPWLALNAAAAVWVTFAGVHASHTADSLVFPLASVYCWTPFFWKQDRIGMLTPLVASWVKDPVANVVLQVGITTFAALCVPLLTLEVLKPARAGRAAATLANALMLALAPDRIVNHWLFECNYPQAMALGCAALLALGTGQLRWWRVGLAAGLMGLSCWAYLGVLMWLMPLVVARGWLRKEQSVRRTITDRRTILELGLCLIGLAAGYVLMLFVRDAHPDYIARVNTTFIPIGRWEESWTAFAVVLDGLPGFWSWVGTLVVLAAIGTAVRRLLNLRIEPDPALVTALLTPALAETLFLGTQYWPTINDYHPRYLLGTLIGMGTVLAWLGIAPLQKWLDRRWVLLPAGVALFAAATIRFGVPARDRPRADLHRLADATDLPLDEIDAVGGYYWTAWPTMFDANLRRYEAGWRNGMVYGVVERSNVLRPLWERTHPDGMRVAVRNTPVDRARFFAEAREVGLEPPEKVATRGRYDIYVTRPARREP